MGVLRVSALKEIKVPDIGDFKNVGVVEVLVQPGETVSEGQCLITVETDKAMMEIPSPGAGVIRELKTTVGATVSQGDLIALFEVVVEPNVTLDRPKSQVSTQSETPVEVPAPAPAPVESAMAIPLDELSPTKGSLPYASPSVRLFSRELGVALTDVTGTGEKGRITHDDVRNFVKHVMTEHLRTAKHETGLPGGLLPWPKIDYSTFGPIERKALSRVRKVSAANLHRNWVMIPHVTNHDDVDITELEAFRQKINQEQAKGSVKLTLLALLIKACVTVLKQFPEFNASMEGDQIILKGYYHIGFAVDTPNGLVVPVIRDVDQKGIMTIAHEMDALAVKAREGKLSVADMSGGCFTISSLGGIGGTYFTPIINAPEVAILGVGRGVIRVVWNGTQAVPRLILPLSLSWDHRVVDGAAAGRFNAFLSQNLTDFRRITL